MPANVPNPQSGPGDHALLPDRLGEPYEPLRDEVGVRRSLTYGAPIAVSSPYPVAVTVLRASTVEISSNVEPAPAQAMGPDPTVRGGEL